jgi:hypothetical protein
MYLKNGFLLNFWPRWKLADLISYTGRGETRIFLFQDEPSIYGRNSESNAYYANSNDVLYVMDGKVLQIHIPGKIWLRSIILEFENESAVKRAHTLFTEPLLFDAE